MMLKSFSYFNYILDCRMLCSPFAYPNWCIKGPNFKIYNICSCPNICSVPQLVVFKNKTVYKLIPLRLCLRCIRRLKSKAHWKTQYNWPVQRFDKEPYFSIYLRTYTSKFLILLSDHKWLSRLSALGRDGSARSERRAKRRRFPDSTSRQSKRRNLIFAICATLSVHRLRIAFRVFTAHY